MYTLKCLKKAPATSKHIFCYIRMERQNKNESIKSNIKESFLLFFIVRPSDSKFDGNHVTPKKRIHDTQSAGSEKVV